MIELKGMKCLITGASRGIGLAIAIRLAKEGVMLSLCASSAESFSGVRHLFDEDSTYFLSGDLMKRKTPGELVKTAAEKMGGIDTVINNAGIAFAKAFEKTDAREWDSVMKLNARAPFLVCRESLEHLRKSRFPSIINISSVVGIKGYENQSAYSASKHALAGFTKAMAREVQKDGIRVHIISPGGVATEMVAGTRPDLDSSVLIKPDEIADIVWYLLTRRGNAVLEEVNLRRDANTPFK
ncbi:MAG: SDR family oxidoreductase [Clostridia bacterium]|nr:SDR family oxidoreductase [Clostridia bacterium]